MYPALKRFDMEPGNTDRNSDEL
ncbi:uncharacterized protein METZ01_LOCUS95015 [marine metagenome]|uniref:Uncharacterized protein n=1 Tax=marine metagenome TaxID=408172 RepID=A0A381VQ23_9ZZZZ